MNLYRSTLLAFVLSFLASPVFSQVIVELGPRVGYEADNLEKFMVGADFRIISADIPVTFNPSLDYFFLGDDGDFSYLVQGVDVQVRMFQIGLNALYEFATPSPTFVPYVGGGLSTLVFNAKASGFGASSSSNETDTALQIIGGASFGAGEARPFAQLQYRLGDINLLTLVAGVTFAF